MSKNPYPPELPLPLIKKAVKSALLEDLGLAGDITSQATLPQGAKAKASFISRENGIVAGIELAKQAFSQIDKNIKFKALLKDGDKVKAKQTIATISGNARAILSSERVALNYLCHLSGIASYSAQFVSKLKGTNAKITDTRKTTPNMRAFEKFAVKCGGGSNHRFGLDDAILIKDNHIAVAGSITKALKATQNFAGHLMAVEIEVDNLEQLKEALEAGAKIVLLDNMDNETLKKAVEINKGRAVLEASGNVTLERAAGIAKTGVNYISTSKITMASTPLDIGLDIDIS